MRANVNNIDYIQQDGQYHIITEYSRLPIESFSTEQEAIDFINGYNNNSQVSSAAINGELFRNFVEIDLLGGIEYKRVREILDKISA